MKKVFWTLWKFFDIDMIKQGCQPFVKTSYSYNLKSKNLKTFVFQFFFHILFLATLICKSISLKITNLMFAVAQVKNQLQVLQ